MGPPLVSVVMPVRDGGQLIVEAARSILEQTLSDLELVIVDDGAPVSTKTILARLRSEDGRVVLLSTNGTTGITQALNTGCAAARGRYIARMDADDVSLPQRLELQVAVLEGSSQIGVIGGQMIAVDLTGSHLWPTAYPSDDTSIRSRLASDNPFGHPTVVMRKDVFEACGGYRDACLHAEDYDLWVRMLDRCRGANLNQTVLLYRVHAGQTAFRDWRQHCLSTLAVQAATRIRRTERRDPLQATGRISEETVRDLGVPDEAVRTRFVESLLALSNVASHVGSRPDRHRLLTQAEAEASRGPIPADTMARLALVQALTAFEDRAPATGTAALIRSVRADRRAAAELGVAWLYRRHPAIFKTLAAVRKLSGRPSWGAT